MNKFSKLFVENFLTGKKKSCKYSQTLHGGLRLRVVKFNSKLTPLYTPTVKPHTDVKKNIDYLIIAVSSGLELETKHMF